MALYHSQTRGQVIKYIKASIARTLITQNNRLIQILLPPIRCDNCENGVNCNNREGFQVHVQVTNM